MIYNTLIIGHKSDKCNLSSLRQQQQQPVGGRGPKRIEARTGGQTESRHVKWRTWCSCTRFWFWTLCAECQNEKGAWHKMSAGYFLLHNHNTHTHTHTHIQAQHAQPAARVCARIETTFSRRLKVCSSSWACHTHTHTQTAANRLSTVRCGTDSTRKPQSSYFLCLPLFLLRLWSLGLVNILQVLLGLAANSALSFPLSLSFSSLSLLSFSSLSFSLN